MARLPSFFLLAATTASALRLTERPAAADPGEPVVKQTGALGLQRNQEAEAAAECSGQGHFPEGRFWVERCEGSDVLCRPENEWQEEWVNYPPREGQFWARPKLAVLMMTMFNVTQPKLWQRWLENANKSKLPYSFSIHMKDRKQKFQNEELAQYLLTKEQSVPPLQSRWCKVASVEWALMHKALEDPEVTHMVMVSGDSIPVKSLEYMLRELEQQPASRMCMDWTVNNRAETWWVMERTDAEFFLEHRDFMDLHLRSGCEEENMWMYSMVLRSWRWGMGILPLIDACNMWTDWGSRCKDWATNAGRGNFTDVRKQWHNDASGGHPRTYFSVTAAGAEELRHSKFWFARKFAENAIPDDVLASWSWKLPPRTANPTVFFRSSLFSAAPEARLSALLALVLAAWQLQD